MSTCFLNYDALPTPCKNALNRDSNIQKSWDLWSDTEQLAFLEQYKIESYHFLTAEFQLYLSELTERERKNLEDAQHRMITTEAFWKAGDKMRNRWIEHCNQELIFPVKKYLFIDHGGVLTGDVGLNPPQPNDFLLKTIEDSGQKMYQILKNGKLLIPMLHRFIQFGYKLVLHAPIGKNDKTETFDTLQLLSQDEHLKFPPFYAMAIYDAERYTDYSSDKPLIPHIRKRGIKLVYWGADQFQGKESLRRALEQCLTIGPEDRTSCCVLDDGPSVISRALEEGYQAHQIGSAQTPTLYDALKSISIDKKHGKPQYPKKDEFLIAETDLIFGKKLGQGAFGIIYEGIYKNLALPVAVKCFQIPTHLIGPIEQAEIENEIDLMQDFKHPNVLSTYGYNMNPYFIVMELMPKGSLDQLLRNQPALSKETRYTLAMDIAHGLAYLHERIIHGDLKSPNILLDNHLRAKIADFGTSSLKSLSNKAMRDAQIEEKNSVASGTNQWLAPELPEWANTRKTDVYSLGCVLSELITGKLPFSDLSGTELNNLKASNKEMDEALYPKDLRTTLCSHYPKYTQLIQSCIFKDARKRPTAEAICKELSHIHIEFLERPGNRSVLNVHGFFSGSAQPAGIPDSTKKNTKNLLKLKNNPSTGVQIPGAPNQPKPNHQTTGCGKKCSIF